MSAALFVCLFAAPASAQFTTKDEVAGYEVAHVEETNVCFIAKQFASEAGRPMIYSFYRTNQGQRWHVAGYELVKVLEGPQVSLRVSIDGTETLARVTETRDGDFMLPFERLEEIEAHEALVESGAHMEIQVGNIDTLIVPLGDFRQALSALDACLAAI